MTAKEILTDRAKMYRAGAVDKRKAALANDVMTKRLLEDAETQDLAAAALEAAIRKLEVSDGP